jgi:hypothetical protein
MLRDTPECAANQERGTVRIVILRRRGRSRCGGPPGPARAALRHGRWLEMTEVTRVAATIGREPAPDRPPARDPWPWPRADP